MRPGIGRTLYYSLLLSLLVIWLGVAASVAWVVYHETEEIFDSSLQETAQRLL
jgi:two-component system OmpR family sensor kinase